MVLPLEFSFLKLLFQMSNASHVPKLLCSTNFLLELILPESQDLLSKYSPIKLLIIQVNVLTSHTLILLIGLSPFELSFPPSLLASLFYSVLPKIKLPFLYKIFAYIIASHICAHITLNYLMRLTTIRNIKAKIMFYFQVLLYLKLHTCF